MPKLLKYVYKRIQAAVVEERGSVGSAAEAGRVERLESVCVVKANIINIGRCKGRRLVASSAVLAIENEPAALDRQTIARTAQLIERRRQLKCLHVSRQRGHILTG